MRYLPVSIPRPVRRLRSAPSPSSTVKKRLEGRMGDRFIEQAASAAAMPMPQSAPSVVPRPSPIRRRYGCGMASCSKSNSTSEFFLADHIHVRLENHGRMLLVAGRGGLAHNDVADLVGTALDAVCSRAKATRYPDLLLLLRRTGTRVMASNCSPDELLVPNWRFQDIADVL